MPDPIVERVRLLRDGSVSIEFVAETRPFTVRATRDEEVYVVGRLGARWLDDGMVDAEMEQRGSWTFRLGVENISVEGRTLTELEGGGRRR